MSQSPVNPLEALKGGFRKACVKRLVGDEPGAIEVLKHEIPGLVVGWAKSTSLDASEKKAKLKELFDDESSRAEELAVAFDLFAGRFETRVATLVQKELQKVVGRMEDVAANLESSLSQAPALSERRAQEEVPSPQEDSFEISKKENREVADSEPEVDQIIGDLDPPAGIGLRFDEIEQMIDEVLTVDDS